MLGGMLGGRGVLAAATAILADGVIALTVLLSAGGYGHAVFSRVAPDDAPGGLVVATAAALGLWLLGMAVLLIGSLVRGALILLVWWPIVLVGMGIALRRLQNARRPLALPARCGGRNLVWVIVAAAAAVWLAGAMMPPGWLGGLSESVAVQSSASKLRVLWAMTGDSAQILGRHLQLPREFFQAGQVRCLSHNVYSHHPLGTEMLALLGMCLRGGAGEGVYAGKLIVGLFGVLAVAGVFGGLRDDGFRARAATALLASAPWCLYLAGAALPELAWVCYLTLGLLWVRQWLARPTGSAAAAVGLCVGGALGAGYAALGLVAGPVLVVMLASAVISRARVTHVALAAALAAGMFAPWMIRTAAATGNPVWPLATSSLGQGHWDEQAAQRWSSAQGPGGPLAVALPPGAQEPPAIGRGLRVAGFFLGPGMAMRVMGRQAMVLHTYLGDCVLLVLAGTLVGMFVRPRGPAGWDWAVLAVLAIQVLAWSWAGAKPARSAAVCVVPVALLCAGGLTRLAGVREVPWIRQTPAAGGRWGLAPAAVLLVVAAGWNVLLARDFWTKHRRLDPAAPPACPTAQYAQRVRLFRAANTLAGPAQLAMIGDDRAFYFPPAARYATAFDEHPLADVLRRAATGEQLAAGLRREGVTHVYVAWSRLDRFAATIGLSDELDPARLRRQMAGWEVVDAPLPKPATATGSAPASGPASAAQPLFALYAVPAAAGAPGSPPAQR